MPTIALGSVGLGWAVLVVLVPMPPMSSPAKRVIEPTAAILHRLAERSRVARRFSTACSIGECVFMVPMDRSRMHGLTGIDTLGA